jgi:hypothetical protein
MVYTPPLYDAFLIDSVARLNKKNAQTVYLINRLRILLNRNQFSKDFKNISSYRWFANGIRIYVLCY